MEKFDLFSFNITENKEYEEFGGNLLIRILERLFEDRRYNRSRSNCTKSYISGIVMINVVVFNNNNSVES